MSRRANDQRRRRARPAQRSPADLWRPTATLDAPTEITPASDPTALVRSLGEPPLGTASIAASHHIAAVVERASALAAALAASAGLLAVEQ